MEFVDMEYQGWKDVKHGLLAPLSSCSSSHRLDCDEYDAMIGCSFEDTYFFLSKRQMVFDFAKTWHGSDGKGYSYIHFI